MHHGAWASFVGIYDGMDKDLTVRVGIICRQLGSYI